MPSFLEDVVDQLYNEYGEDISNICFVLPSRRAGSFLKKYLSEKLIRSLWSPPIYSIEEFVSEITGLSAIDPIVWQLEFYKIYSTLESNPEPIDTFLNWAPQLLKDFNEIDAYMIPTDQFFDFVNDVRAIEVWNPDGSPPTDMQKKYIAFWKSIGMYYGKLRDHLVEKNLVYSGLAYRKAAEGVARHLMVNDGQLCDYPWKKVVFVGFNAINKAEETIIDHLKFHKLARVFWQADKFYMDDEEHEAGMFLRRWYRKWGRESFGKIENQFVSNKKKIRIFGLPGNMAMAKYAGEVLKENQDWKDPGQSALVLADENLLLPVLNGLPDETESFNVTLGLPVKNSPVQGLWEAITLLNQNASVSGDGVTTFYHKDIERLLNHPVFYWVDGLSSEIASILFTIKKHNLVRWRWGMLKEFKSTQSVKELHKFQFLFDKKRTKATEFIALFLQMVETLKVELEEKESNKTKDIFLELLYLYSRTFTKLNEILKSYQQDFGISGFKRLLSNMESGLSVPFFGEPLTGLQVMGMLETRVLDFKKIVMLSVNEGILPAGKKGASFMPFEVRTEFKLPTHHEKDAIFAYHFYRMLQNADDITLLYNAQKDMNGGEESRFVKQLKIELKALNSDVEIEHKIVSLNASREEAVEVEIKKSEEVIQLIDRFLQERGLSPSALNDYINSPLNFYYKHIVGIKESEEVEETIEQSTFGSIVHKVLEEIYTPFEKKVINPEQLKKEASRIEELTRLYFEQEFGKSYQQGKNYLSYKVAERFAQTFIDSEVNQLKKNELIGQYTTLMSREERLERTLVRNGKSIKLKGFADRIDKQDRTIQIIDYKTGKVEPLDLKISNMDQLWDSQKKGKALQLFMYAWMYYPKLNEGENISAGIYSLRKSSNGLMLGQLNSVKAFDEGVLNQFEEFLTEVIDEMYDPTIPLADKEGSMYTLFE